MPHHKDSTGVCKTIPRRTFISGCLSTGAASVLCGDTSGSPSAAAPPTKPRTILLRSAWQTVNIGDIAHTPGVLRLLEQHLPEASVILWPGSLDRGVEPLLRRRFPKLRVVRDAAGWRSPRPRSDDPTIEEAIGEADLMMHGSAANLGARADLERWDKQTGKPYGAYGVTLGSTIGIADGRPDFPPELRRVLDGAAFIFTRETTSLNEVRRLGLRRPVLDFAPDGTFALDLRDDRAARRFLRGHDLKPGTFLCAVPRLRITPYWEIHPERKMAAEEIAWRKAVNEKYAEADHAKLREALTIWVRETGLKVLVCPEMTYEVGMIRPFVFDPLPGDVKRRVVPMDRYWLTDEAASVYRAARAVVSMECHSPIIANANGRPGVYLRQPTDTWKGQMYPDLGLGDWKIELETTTGREIGERLLKIHNDYDGALALADNAAREAARRHAKTMGVVRKVLGA